MSIYAQKTASGCAGAQAYEGAIAPKVEPLNDVIGRVATRADNLRLAVERITNRLLDGASANAADSSVPAYGNAELDAIRADRILSGLEGALSYLENRIG